MTTEQLAALKEVAKLAAEKIPHSKGCQCMRDFERAFRPTMCKELVEEVERLRAVVNAAVEWRRFGYEREHEFCVGISPLLDAIDVYDVGQRRPSPNTPETMINHDY